MADREARVRSDQEVLPRAALRHARRITWLLSAAVPIVIALWYFTAVASGIQREGYFGADDLYAPTLLTDLLSWSGRLRDWRLTPAPYYFPDLCLYAAAHVLAPNVELAQYVAALSHLLLFVWLSQRLTRHVVRDGAVSLACVALVWLPLLLLNLTHRVDAPGISPLYRLTNHGGAALGALAVLYMGMRDTRAPLVLAALVAAVSFGLGVSDPLFAASCSAPLLVLGILACVKPVWARLMSPCDRERATLRARFLIAGATGLAGAYVSGHVHWLSSELHGIALSPTRQRAWNALVHELSGGSAEKGAWLLLVCVLALGLLLRRPAPRSASLRVLALWQIDSIVSSLGAIVWTRNYLDGGSLRYLNVPFALAPVFVGAVMARAIVQWQHAARAVTAVAGLLLIASCGTLVICPALLARGSYRSDWRDKAGCVAQVLEREGVYVALTDYWRCKPLRLFSGGRVQALQMRAKLKRPYYWIASRGWYRGEHRFGVIVTNDLRPDAITRAYGEPAQVDRCADLELFSYRGRARDKLSAHMRKLFNAFLADPHPP